MAPAILLPLLSAVLTPVLGFGTVDSPGILDQQQEHERITRAALHCVGDAVSADCFSPTTLNFLAGSDGQFGAVGNPDNVFDWTSGLGEPAEAHCDDADFLDVPGYPQSRETATANLMRCVAHIHERLQQGLDAAARILDAEGYINPDQAKIPTFGCSTSNGIESSTAKCSALLGFGRGLHGVQDFYSHSNWADHEDSTLNISVTNPPGLGNTNLAPFLDSRFIGPPFVPRNLTTGCFAGFGHDDVVGQGVCTGRVTHHALNKDGGVVDPNNFGTTTAGNPGHGPRDTAANFQLAVAAAERETQRQWRTFRDALVETHGDEKAARIICALTRDDPPADCNGRKIGIVVDSSGSNQDTDPGNLRVAAATQINARLITAKQAAANANAKPDLVTAVDFDSSARVIYPLGDPSGAGFDSIDSSGGTYIAGGIAAAIDEIVADTKYKTRGRSGIVVLTDGEDSAVAARLAQLARAWVNGIKVSFGFLSPVDIPVATPRRLRRGEEGEDATGLLLSRQSSTSNDVLVAILKTGGLYATIDSAAAQLAFVQLVFANGLTDADDGRSATQLVKGLGVLGLVQEARVSKYFSYKVAAGEDVSIKLEARSSQCEFAAALTAVEAGVLLGNTSFSGSTGLPSTLNYTASAAGQLELEVSATGPSSGANGTLECVFSVQLAGVYVAPPNVTSSSVISSSTRAPNSTATSSFAGYNATTTSTTQTAPATSTIRTTTVYTVTSCKSDVPNCPARTAPYVTTETLVLATSTIYSTSIYTVTSCAATVTDCPAKMGKVTTEIVPLTTTVCPVATTPTPTATSTLSAISYTATISGTVATITATGCPGGYCIPPVSPLVSSSVAPTAPGTGTACPGGSCSAAPSKPGNSTGTAKPSSTVVVTTAGAASLGETLTSVGVKIAFLVGLAGLYYGVG